MAAGDIAPRSGISDMQNILNIFKGAPGSTTTNTSSEVVSNDKATAYLKQMLESNSGLAAVSGAQKSSGMYGSTVNTQLTNDLLARAASQTAALSSTKTASQTTKGQAQLDPMKTVAGLALGQILTPIAKAGSKKLGLDDIGNKISDSIFGSPDTANISATPVDTSSFDNLNKFLGDNSLSDPGTKSGSAGMDALSTAAGISAGAGLAGAAAGGGEAAAAAGLADASYAIGGTGTFMAADAAATAGSTALAAGATDAAATAAGSAGIGEFLTTLATAAAWIICTELNKQGRLPYRYYIYGAREFAKYDERGKQGYYIWAIPSVKHLRKHPNSLYSKLMEVVFNARAEYLAAKAGCKGARKTVIGFATTHGLYGVCWTLSRTIARKSYTKEQILTIGV